VAAEIRPHGCSATSHLCIFRSRAEQVTSRFPRSCQPASIRPPSRCARATSLYETSNHITARHDTSTRRVSAHVTSHQGPSRHTRSLHTASRCMAHFPISLRVTARRHTYGLFQDRCSHHIHGVHGTLRSGRACVMSVSAETAPFPPKCLHTARLIDYFRSSGRCCLSIFRATPPTTGP
jgi:hypothetical protein